MRSYLNSLVKIPLLSLYLLAASADAQQTWTVNFNDADIQEVIRFVADASERTLVVDPRVKGRVTVISAEPLSAEALYDLFLSVLEVHGFAAIEVGNVTRIVPGRDVRSSPLPVTDESGLNSNEYLTQVISLNNVAAIKMLPVLRPLVPRHSHLAAYAPGNAIVVSDTAANIARIRRLIERIDLAAVVETELIPLQHAEAEEVVRMLTQLERDDSKHRRGGRAELMLVADKRINGVLVSGDEMQRRRAIELIESLDQPLETEGNMRVVYLKHGDAVKVAEVMSKIVQNMDKISLGDKSAGGIPATVEADESTNSLLIAAEAGVLPSLLDVVKKLDIRRAQVLVEAIIVEVNGTGDDQLGLQWLFQSDSGGVSSSSRGDGSLAGVGAGIFGGTNKVERDSDGNIIRDETTDLARLGAAMAGSEGELFGLGKLSDNTGFVLLLNALEKQDNTNILSTPNLLTTDNHEAMITVGQNVPFVTGSFTSPGDGDGVRNPFQTIERESVGLTLKITPHINQGNSVALDLVQESSELQGAVKDARDIVTSERKIETRIMAEDGEIVVLGGLIREEITNVEQRVPFLGSIPGLGRLFRSDSAAVRKTNLLVFIRPTIIRDDETLTGATAEKYRFIREQQIKQRQRGSKLIEDRNVFPVMPEWDDAGGDETDSAD